MWFILNWPKYANHLSLRDEEICKRENQWYFWEKEWKHMTFLKGRQWTLSISQSHNCFTFSSFGMVLSLGSSPELVLHSLGFGAEKLCGKKNCKGWKWCFCYILASSHAFIYFSAWPPAPDTATYGYFSCKGSISKSYNCLNQWIHIVLDQQDSGIVHNVTRNIH